MLVCPVLGFADSGGVDVAGECQKLAINTRCVQISQIYARLYLIANSILNAFAL